MSSHLVILGGITLLAAVVNGALGYGFSSITVPLALLFMSNRMLNPALILVEVFLNAYVLWVNREALSGIWRRALPVLLGLVPGVMVGTAILTRVNPDWLKLTTFGMLLPLILLQAAGFRRPIRAERAAGVCFGGGVGALYAITTLSGPPLAIFLNNQGFAKREFRAALGLIRFVESTLTSTAYAYGGLFTAASTSLTVAIVPSVMIGVPLGAWAIRRVRPETFRRVCMSFDAAIVAFGTSWLLRELHIVESGAAYLLLASVMVLDATLLYRFFKASSRNALAAPQPHTS